MFVANPTCVPCGGCPFFHQQRLFPPERVARDHGLAGFPDRAQRKLPPFPPLALSPHSAAPPVRRLASSAGENSFSPSRPPPDLRDVVAAHLWLFVAVARPRLHQLASLVEQVTASICGFDFVSDGVRERHFGNVMREAGAFLCPI